MLHSKWFNLCDLHQTRTNKKLRCAFGDTDYIFLELDHRCFENTYRKDDF